MAKDPETGEIIEEPQDEVIIHGAKDDSMRDAIQTRIAILMRTATQTRIATLMRQRLERDSDSIRARMRLRVQTATQTRQRLRFRQRFRRR